MGLFDCGSLKAWLLKRSPARGPPSRSRGSRCARRGAARTGRSRGSKSTRRTAPYHRGRRAEADAGCEESRRIERRRHRQDVGVHRAERSHPEGDRTYSRLIISRGSSRGIGASRRISAHLGSSLPSEGSSSASGAKYLGEAGRDRSEKRPFWPDPGPAPRARRPLQRAPRPARTWSGRLPEIARDHPRSPEITCATACPNLVGERWKGERTSKPASQRRAGARSIDCSMKGPTLCSALGDSLRLSRKASTAAGRGGR